MEQTTSPFRAIIIDNGIATMDLLKADTIGIRTQQGISHLIRAKIDVLAEYSLESLAIR